jgi:hypothetical protein
MARVAAGAFGFLIFSHAFDGPDLYGESSFFETMPKPSLQMALNISTPSPWPSTLNANYLQVWTRRVGQNRAGQIISAGTLRLSPRMYAAKTLRSTGHSLELLLNTDPERKVDGPGPRTGGDGTLDPRCFFFCGLLQFI